MTPRNCRALRQSHLKSATFAGVVHLPLPAARKTNAFNGFLLDRLQLSVAGFDGIAEEEVLRVAAAVEEQSNHPLAAAIVKAAKERKINFPTGAKVENLSGRGIRANIEGQAVVLGALRAFEGTIDGPVLDTVKKMELQGQTTVILQRAGVFVGVIGLADEPRAGAKPTVARLKKFGIEHIVMLTGDNEAVAKRVSSSVGVEDVRAGLLPEQKLELIQELQKKYGAIAMVGDGVNDAPALAAAPVGIAMGGGGTAVALETADVALMGDDLEKLGYAVGLSRASQRIIKQNLVIALGVIGILVVAAFAGVIPLSIAVVFYEGSTVAVAMNALRLLAWEE